MNDSNVKIVSRFSTIFATSRCICFAKTAASKFFFNRAKDSFLNSSVVYLSYCLYTLEMTSDLSFLTHVSHMGI